MKKKLTAIGFVKIIKKSLGDTLLLRRYEALLNFIAVSLRIIADSYEVRGTITWHKYHEAVNKIHDALEKRGYYDD